MMGTTRASFKAQERWEPRIASHVESLFELRRRGRREASLLYMPLEAFGGETSWRFPISLNNTR